jgi:hypothetical protein
VESELPEAAMMMLSAVVVCQFLLFWFWFCYFILLFYSLVPFTRRKDFTL